MQKKTSTNNFLKNTKGNKKNVLLVCDDIISKYNATGAYVFAHLAYHICKNGNYDSAPSTAARYIGCSKSTVIDYIKKFIEDGLLKEISGKRSFRKALKFNDNNDFIDVVIRYHSFVNGTKGKSNKVSLVQVYPHELELSECNKQEFLRKEQFFTAYIRDKLANQRLNNKDNVKFDTFVDLAHKFNLAVNTIKKVLLSLKSSKLVKYSKDEFSVLKIKAGALLLSEIDKKVKAIRRALNPKISVQGFNKPSFY